MEEQKNDPQKYQAVTQEEKKDPKVEEEKKEADPSKPVPVDRVMKLWIQNIDENRKGIKGKLIFLITVEMLLIVFLGVE